MPDSEYVAFDHLEQQHAAPELFDYLTVLEAFTEHDIPEDDIASIGDVVIYWAASVPSWSHVQDMQRARTELEVTNEKIAEVKQLLEKAEQLFIEEHWDQAREVQAEGNKLLLARPKLFYVEDSDSGQRFTLETLLLTGDHTRAAGLYVSGEGHTLAVQAGSLMVAIDATKLLPKERAALTQYVTEMEIAPHA
jgi:hypothetical protein